MAKYNSEEPNIWIQPIMSGYKMMCCDCGLVHNMDFKIENNRVEFKVDRNNRATSAARRNNKWEYYAQNFNKECFVVAVCNVAIYLRELHNWNKLLRIAKCENGGAINEIGVIKTSKLPLKQTDNWNKVVDNGGIITILHPLFNLHACFIEKINEGNIKIINSWLGSNEIIITPNEIKKFIPKSKNNRRFYYLNENKSTK